MAERIVGTNRLEYTAARNFGTLPFRKYEVKRVRDFSQMMVWLSYKFRGKIPLYYENSFRDFNLNKVDILHFYNALSFGKTPWVVTYETQLPRWGHISPSLTEKGLKLLTRKSCGAIIANCASTKNMQLHFLREQFPDYLEEISAKIHLVHPPQLPLIEKTEDKTVGNDEIVFVIAGTDFFRKGGAETLRVFDRLIAEKAPVRLVVISKLSGGDWASQSTKADYETARHLIARHAGRIEHYSSLPNEKVLDIFRRAHIGLLPTYADTYGYTVLEAQAAGCPVISTDIRVMPEINTPECGWLIEVPKTETGNGKIKTESERKDYSKAIEEGLYSTISGILKNPESILQKGTNSLARIRTEHSPESRAALVEAIYDKILG